MKQHIFLIKKIILSGIHKLCMYGENNTGISLKFVNSPIFKENIFAVAYRKIKTQKLLTKKIMFKKI